VKAHTTFLFNTPWMKRRVQYLLNMQSYEAGAVDGDFGSRSVDAFNRFQRDQQIETSSEISRVTVESLVRLHQAAMSTPRGTLPEDLVG
jgi:peptidoglycan hydrolase-like protein with peptidoglycan-binding domain